MNPPLRSEWQTDDDDERPEPLNSKGRAVGPMTLNSVGSSDDSIGDQLPRDEADIGA